MNTKLTSREELIQELILSRHLREQRTLTEIGWELGISPERVRQLEARALEKLRLQSEQQPRSATP